MHGCQAWLCPFLKHGNHQFLQLLVTLLLSDKYEYGQSLTVSLAHNPYTLTGVSSNLEEADKFINQSKIRHLFASLGVV